MNNNRLEQLKRAVLLQRLEQRNGARKADASSTPIGGADRGAPLPLSFAQQRLWFLDQLDDAAGAAYHIPAALRLQGQLDVAALRATLDRIVARHESLRTTFISVDGQPVQRIASAAAGFALDERDLSSLPLEQRTAAVERVRDEETRTPFDLSAGPLIRGRLLKLAADEYVLLVTQHHIVSDGWSIDVLVREVSALYAAFSQRLPDPLPALALQYADYAVWQRQWLQGQVLQGQIDFWKSRLDGAPALIDLPTDRPRPARQSYAGNHVELVLPAGLSADLRALAQRHGVTLFMTLLAGWSALLARLSGQDDIVVGTPVANRQRTEVEPIIGFFVNTLALRLRVDGDPSVADLLAQVKSTTLDAYAHQDLPFEYVVDALNPVRSLSHSPIFQVLFTLNNLPGENTLAMPGLTLTGLPQTSANAQFDLSLSLTDGGDRLEGHLHYATDLFDRATVERLARHFVTLLSGLTSDPAQKVSRLPLLSEAERHRLLVEFNATDMPYPSGQLIHQLFEDQAARQPDATALLCGAQQLSYGELNRRANGVAHALGALGVRPDDRVAICVERGFDMVVGLLAVLKAGGAYVPLDPAYPVERLAHMIADSAPRVLLTHAQVSATVQQPLRSAIAALDRAGVVLDLQADAGQWDEAPDRNPAGAETGLTSSHLAYVIYTSGSTGLPKGVAIEHRNAVNFLHWAKSAFSARQMARTMFSTSLNFDLAVYECFAPLALGTTLDIVPNALDLIGKPREVTLINTVPSALHALVDANGVPASVDTVNLAGEPLKRALVERLFAQTDVALVCNLYGPSETTTYSTWVAMPREQGFASHIGRPIANTRIYLLDAHGQPAPIGVAGELYIGGDGVARGYLNRPELTAERFLPDPFSDAPDARMYRTGDLGRYLPDGNIEYLGRNDFQVKIRGFRVELGEIEARLAACDGVGEAHVMAREDSQGDKRLVAYLVAEEGADVSAAGLRAELAAVLPEYMVPSAYVMLDAVPLTPNGKLDRRALPAPDTTALIQRAYEAPQGGIETVIAEVWQQLLGLEQVGRHDNFFELGGHSLLAIGLVERLRRRGVETHVRTLFAAPVLSVMAAAIAGQSAPAADTPVPANLIAPDCSAITPAMLPLVTLTQEQVDRIVASVPQGAANVQDIYPLAPLQEGILFHHLLQSEGDAYLMRCVMEFDSRSRLDAFLAALQTVIDRHDILRSAVRWTDLPQAVQVVYCHACLPVEDIALNRPGAALQQLLDQTDPRKVRLDLQHAPLIAARIGADPLSGRWLLALLNHHMVGDHVTIELILDEVRALLQGEGDRLAPSIPYRNFIATTQAVAPAEHEAYFREQLGDIDEPTAPFGVLAAHGDGGPIREARLALDDGLALRIRAVVRERGISAAVLFHVAWAQVVARCSGRDDVVFGTVLSGRMQGAAGADRMLGLFINTLPIRIRLGGKSVVQALQDTYQNLSQLLVHEQAPLALAQRCSALAPSMPLFSALFNYRHSPAESAGGDSGHEWAGMRFLAVEEHASYPIDMAVDDFGAGFGLTAQCLAGIDPQPLVASLRTAVDALVHALADDPQQPVASLTILPADQRRQLLVDFNATDVAFPLEEGYAALFARQVARFPERNAAVCAGRTLAYRELDLRSNRLAHALVAAGAGPDTIVALMGERDLPLLVMMVAVLKAGAAFLPLDVHHPVERLREVLVSSRAPLVLLAQGVSTLFDDVTATMADVPQALVTEQLWLDGIADALPPRSGGGDLAYVIFTSGSTGKPKGALVEQRGMLNNMLGKIPTVGLGPDDRVAQTASPAFDISVWQFLAAPLVGATVHILPDAVVHDPLRLIDAIEDAEITLLEIVPSLMRAMLDLCPAEPDSTVLASLRWVLPTGEALPLKVAQDWFGRFPHVPLMNVYGPAECADDVAFHAITARPADDSVIPIGRPTPNNRLYIVDDQLQPVPVGVAGEICVAGSGVGRGYLHDPAQTAAVFIDHPFAPGERFYRTGDIGRYRADGTIEFVGRRDHQVKIRGFRIELGEIEARLASCAGVVDAVMMAREDVPGDKRLVAYLTTDGSAPVAPAGLRQQLAAVLPDYMVPGAFVTLDAFPLSPNGKIDRRALPAPDQSAVVTRRYEAPQGDVEIAVAQVWQQLLGVDQVGRHDHFFELGGHSLIVVQLVSRLRQALDVEVPLRDVFSYPTLALFARAVGEARQAVLPPIVPCDRGQILPLSFAQQRLWFLDQLDDAAGAAYHIPAALRLQGQLDVAALRATLDRIVARHESLRTTFISVDGQPVQRIASADTGFALDERDLSSLPPAQRAAAIERIGDDEARGPFDLSAGPLIRGQLLKLAADEYVLLVTQHHIVSDGWSTDVLVREVSALYTAFSQGLPDPLPALALHYADYAMWQRQWLQGQVLQGQIDFWKSRLDGAPALLDLPTDRPRPARQSYAGSHVDIILPAALSADLRALAQRHGVTMFMTLLAGWSALLARLSGQHDIVVGTPVANRQRTEVEPIIGLFVNTLALRVRTDDAPSVAALLAQVRSTTLDAYAHQDLPFEYVVDALNPVRSLSHSPIFQVLFTLNNLPGENTLALPGLTLTGLPQTSASAQFDLSLSLTDGGDRLEGHLHYATDLFDRATVERLAGHFVTLLTGLAGDPAQKVSRLPLLSEAERHLLLVELNATGTPYPSGQLIHQLFEVQAARQPDATALVFGAQQLSYGELNRRANGVAHGLLALGVRPDDRVALCAERGIGMVVGLLGVLKAGAAYVPLDPAYPAERLAHMLADSAPVCLLTQTALLPVLQPVVTPARPVVLLDDLPAPGDHDPVVPDLHAGHLAYVIYTSGSTGVPKGVMIEHRAVVNFLHSMSVTPGLDASDTLLAVTTLSFDIAGLELYLPLMHGAKVVLLSQPEAATPESLTDALERHAVTMMQATPATWRLLLASGWQGAPGLRVLCGGEALTADLAHDLIGRTDALWNMYGPTETTIWSSCKRVDGAAPSPGAQSIGRPIANTTMYLLDEHLQPVPFGVAGELYIGGAGVARGYLNRPELTAERFVTDPFSGAPDARMYRTGDLGRYLPGGDIDYLGRNDFQVKIRGFRIELGEIEAKLAACDGVREAHVMAREDVPGDKRLVAYLLAHEGVGVSAAALRAELAAALPEYMVPSAYVMLDAFPLTPNGKLDRRALPAPDTTALVQCAYEAPQGELERMLAAIWQDLLGLEQVGRHDNFFELGGHSLLVLQLVARLRHHLGRDVPLREVFAHPTLQSLAVAVEASGQAELATIPPADRSAALPLSFGQLRLWFLDQLEDDVGTAYHMPVALRLRGPLHKPALQATFARVVARHESLRTRFVSVDGQPTQSIAPADIGFALDEVDLSALPGHERQFAVTRFTGDEVSSRFDLAAGPLIRARLLHLAEQEHVLLVTMHHIVSDGWSAGVLVREVTALYAAFSQGLPDPLPPLPIQYADYAAWQRQWLQGDILQQQLAFWQEQLDGAPALLELPTDRPRPLQQSYAGASLALTLAPELDAGVRSLSRRYGTTLFMTMLAAWSVLMARMSGQNDVVIGTPVANRQRTEIEGLIGFFVNTLALRVRTDDDPSVAQLLARVKATTLQAYAHQELPFEQVVEALQPERNLSHSPIFQVMLDMQTAREGGTGGLSALDLEPVELPHFTAQFDLTLSLIDTGTGLTGNIEYATDLFDAATVERLAGSFVTLLDAMVADDGQRVRRLPVLGAQEREQLLYGWNATDVAFPLEEGYAALFAERVARFPERRAAVCAGRTLTYRELDLRSNRLAHALVAAGAGPETIVALMGERDLPLLVMMVAVLKAGAAFLPLDVHHPVERLREVLVSSRAPLVLLAQGVSTLFDDVTATMADVPQALVTERLWLHGVADALPPRSAGGDLAYVIFTSGSTGKPKGALVEQRGMLNNMLGKIPTVGLGPDDRVAQTASPAFDISVWQFLAAPLVGGTVHILPDAVVHDPLRLIEAIGDADVTLLEIVPSLMRAMLDLCPSGPALASLRWVLPTGEALPLKVAQDWFARFPHVPLMNVYGPAECADDVAFHAITARPADDDVIPIGRPTPNNRLYIVDDQLQPVPVGVAGEICVAGTGVGRGYLHDPVRTAAVFIDHPFAPGERFYRTGDIGRYRADGTIEFVGRRDHQVKIRGFRIELGEIEAQLAACEGVIDAVVMAREDVPGDKRLVAYLTTDGSTAVEPAALRQQLAAVLPEYMVPGAFVTLDAFPLSPNGKIDRRALPTPDQSAVVTRTYEAPQGEVEHALAAIWQQLLGLERVGRHDHFFELGGHSLLVLQLVARLRHTLGRDVPLRDVFAHPTLHALAIAVRAAGKAGLETIPPADRSAALPLSFGQMRLWFLDQLEDDVGTAYHMPVALRLRGPVHKPALRATLARIVARHESLRTRFVGVDGQPTQSIAPADIGFPLDEHDLSTLPGREQQFAVTRFTSDEVSLRFDLAVGPLIRGRLLHLAEHDHILLLTVHHIVSDGWSMGVLAQEVSALYSAFSQGLPDPLPPLPIQYADYAAWQRRWLQGDVLQRQIGYWTAHLDGAPALLELPTDRPRPPRQSHAGSSVALALAPELGAGLHALSRRHGTTLFMTLLAAWSVLLARLSGQDDVVVGTPVANRRHTEVEGLIGFFVNTLALRVRIDDDPSVAQLLARVKADTLGAYAHQDVPFEQVVEALQPQRNLSHSPIFQAMLNLDNTPDDGGQASSPLQLTPVDLPYTSTPFDLTLSLVDTGETIAGTLDYATELFDAATAERLARQFQTVLRAMVSDDGRQVSRLDLLDDQERRQLLVEFNANDADYPQGELIHQLFEAQVRARPQAAALVWHDQELTYDALNRRANRLAHRLIALGIAADRRVAICVERGIDMVVAVLAVLKAGGAYVPLDPAYPAERLAHMLADSAPVVLLTQTALQSRLPSLALPSVLLDGEDGACLAQPDGNPDGAAHALTPDRLAYVIYTSGSTGKPKGVMNRHRSLCNLARAQIAMFDVDADSRVLQLASFSFDASVSEMMMSLCSGACLCLAPAEALRPGAPLMATLLQHRITHVTVPSSALAVCIDDARLAPLTLIVAGDVCPPGLAAQWASRHRLFNAYGPTEATVCATIYRYDPAREGVFPIGRPIANSRIYILDAHLQPVPLGARGDIHIGGVGVARGYLNRPDLSAERFIGDPFAGDGATMYKTGDIGRWLPDGTVEYLGRNDFQVKLRGFRIEPGEIEAQLAACAAVRDAVVVAREDIPGDRRLVAYVVAQDGASLGAAQLRASLALTLADYMMPSAFVVLDAFPLTPNGKVDRRALPAPDQSAMVTRTYAAPQGVLETGIARLWQQLLGLDQVGRHDHFFELGGHSLLGVQLISRLHRELGVDIPLRELFVRPVLHEFADACTAHGAGKPATNLVPIRTAGNLPPLFLIHAQGGEVAYARAMARWLPPDMPVYGLAASGLSTGETPLSSVEAMATLYIAAMRSVQAHGPYHVAGWSAGGTLAYEIAHQLTGAGASVAFVGLIDTESDYTPDVAAGDVERPVFEDDEMNFLMSWLPRDTPEPLASELWASAAGTTVDVMLARFLGLGLLPPQIARDTDLSLLRRHLAVSHAMQHAVQRYVPPALAVPVTLFAAADDDRTDVTRGWENVCRERLRTISVEGNHLTLMEMPNLQKLGETLAASVLHAGQSCIDQQPMNQ